MDQRQGNGEDSSNNQGYEGFDKIGDGVTEKKRQELIQEIELNLIFQNKTVMLSLQGSTLMFLYAF